MKIRFFLLLILLAFANISSSQVLEYQGIGILKVVKGDTVHILPDNAFVINPQIFQLGSDALDYVESNKSDSLILVLNDKIEFLENENATLSYNYEKSLNEQKQLVQEIRISNGQLQLKVKEQESHIDNLEAVSKRKSEILTESRKKIRRRTVVLVAPIVVLVAKIGYDYFAK